VRRTRFAATARRACTDPRSEIAPRIVKDPRSDDSRDVTIVTRPATVAEALLVSAARVAGLPAADEFARIATATRTPSERVSGNRRPTRLESGSRSCRPLFAACESRTVR